MGSYDVARKAQKFSRKDYLHTMETTNQAKLFEIDTRNSARKNKKPRRAELVPGELRKGRIKAGNAASKL